ncbi:MAG: GTP-binding protein [Tissierellia bacterium]|nr:GTP-binding protein [Tissierellia bacterium]
MKILIVSGFLGAGKTTFIKHLAKVLDRKFVIMENEYGNLNLDKVDLERSSLEIWEMTEGCICCSIEGDFAASVLTVANALDPDILIVEPTGVGQLSAILKNLKRIEYERIRLLEPITLVDCNTFEESMKEYGDFYSDQIKNAGKVFITKQEDANVNSLYQELMEIKGDERVYKDHYSEFDKEFYEKLLNTYWNDGIREHSMEDIPDFTTISFENFEFKDKDEILSMSNMILRGNFGKIYRAKGYIPVGDETIKYDLVDKKLDVVYSDVKKSAMVFIGQNLDKESLKILFETYKTE